MRNQAARKDELAPNTVPIRQPSGRPARFVITSELRGYELANSSPPIAPEKEPKIVTLDPPLDAQCMSIDGAWRIDCLVLAVWDEGARLKVERPKVLTQFSEFFLLFTSAQKPVFRHCKRVWTRGYEIGVKYQRKQATYLRHMEYDNDS